LSSRQNKWAPLEGFITPNFLPSKLNGWDGDCGGEFGVTAPIFHQGGVLIASSSKHKKKKKCIWLSPEDPNLILGEYLSMAEIVEMENKTVVGKVYGRHFNENTLKEWAASSWGSTFNPPPKINRLCRGWFMIIFAEVTQANWVLQMCCSIDSSLVLIKLWDTTFDASSESLDYIPI